MCPQVQEDMIPQVNVVSEFFNQPRKYDPYSNQYTLGWRDRMNLGYGKPNNQPQHQTFGYNKPVPAPKQASSSGMSLEEIVIPLATDTQMFQQETRASIKTWETKFCSLH